MINEIKKIYDYKGFFITLALTLIPSLIVIVDSDINRTTVYKILCVLFFSVVFEFFSKKESPYVRLYMGAVVSYIVFSSHNEIPLLSLNISYKYVATFLILSIGLMVSNYKYIEFYVVNTTWLLLVYLPALVTFILVYHYYGIPLINSIVLLVNLIIMLAIIFLYYNVFCKFHTHAVFSLLILILTLLS